jgi:predicted nucleotidyltransferase
LSGIQSKIPDYRVHSEPPSSSSPEENGHPGWNWMVEPIPDTPPKKPVVVPPSQTRGWKEAMSSVNLLPMESEHEKILARLRAGLPALKREFPLRRLALFGSVARGEASTGSDIDILADVEPSIGLDFVTLAERLEELTGHKVDLVSRRAIKPLLWKQIEPDLVDV